MSISKQTKWQRKKVAKGLCKTCGKKKIFKSSLCRLHYLKTLEKNRIRLKKERKSYHELLRVGKEAVALTELIEKWAESDQGDSYEIMDEIVSVAQNNDWKEIVKLAEA